MIPKPYKKYKIKYICFENDSYNFLGEAIYLGETSPSELGLYHKPLFLFEIVKPGVQQSFWKPLAWFNEEDIVKEIC